MFFEGTRSHSYLSYRSENVFHVLKYVNFIDSLLGKVKTFPKNQH